MINKKIQDYWNQRYLNGRDYRLINESEVQQVVDSFAKAKTALDIGCGTGDLARKLAKNNLQVTAVDVSNAALSIAKEKSTENITYKLFDIENDDLAKLGGFDLVFAKLLLAFINDKEKLVSKVSKNINKDGRFIIITPVVDGPSQVTPHQQFISVDKNETKELLKKYFDKVEINRVELEPGYSMVTFIAST